MSTFIEIFPVIHETKKTTAVRIDDDFRMTVREEEPDKDAPSTIVKSDFQRNYSGVAEGEMLGEARVQAPVRYVRVGKLGSDARCIIGVTCYYPENEAHLVPAPGFYAFNTATHYRFGSAAETGKTEAPNPTFEGTAQAFPIVIFNTSTQGALPVGNTVAVSFTAQSLYVELGDTQTRRAYLKQKVRDILEDRNLPMWLAGNTLSIVLFRETVMIAQLNEEIDLSEQELPRRQQAFTFWLEMLTRAISIDANFSTAAKFDKMHAECSRSAADIIGKTALDTFGGVIAANTSRASWNFVTLNTSLAQWTASSASDISVDPVASEVNDDWMAWLRS